MATETTVTSAKAWAPDLRVIPVRDAIPDALVLSTSTVAGAVEGDAPAVRVPYVDDASAGFVAEGAAITEADPALSEILVYTGKIAQLIRLSREQYVQPDAASLLSESVTRAVTKAANAAYLTQVAPTGPAVTPPAGLLNVSGIVSAGAVATSLDALVDGLAAVAGNGANAATSTIVIDPVGWAKLRKLKTATGSNISILGAGTADAVPYLLGVPVVVSSAMPASTGLVIDKTAVVSAVGPVNVAMSEDVYFNTDSIGLRATFRFGANVVKANRIAKFTIT